MNEREAPESDLRLQAQAAPIADLQAAALLAVKLGHYRDHREAPAVLQALLDFAGAGLGDAITDSERAAFGPPFLFAPSGVRPARITIALELELVELLQQGGRGARSVADGEWRDAMSADSSLVFRPPERSQWRAQWGSGWPERPPVLGPLTALALPIA